MDLTIIYVFAAALALAGVFFLYFLFGKGGWRAPSGAVEWAGAFLSVLLILSGAFLVTLVVQPPPQTGPLDAQGYPALADTEMDAPAPDFGFTLVDDEQPGMLSGYRGKVVLLNFWATWCAPCLEELPALNELQDRYRDEGLVVLNVSDEEREQLVAFQRDLPLRTTSAFIDDAESLPEPFGRTIAVRPNSYVIDREGVIREYVMGARTLPQFEQLVRPYLDRPVASSAL